MKTRSGIAPCLRSIRCKMDARNRYRANQGLTDTACGESVDIRHTRVTISTQGARRDGVGVSNA